MIKANKLRLCIINRNPRDNYYFNHKIRLYGF